MDLLFQRDSVIDVGDTDLRGHCRAAALLNMLQKASTDHAQMLGISSARMAEECNAFWMLARMWFQLRRPLLLGEALTIQTWHRGLGGATMYRDFDLLSGGDPVGEAVSLWVLADMDDHRLCRASQLPSLLALPPASGERGKSLRLSRLRIPKALGLVEWRRMQYSDADLNGHVNNTRYADFACDALRLEHLSPREYVKAMQICYIKECYPGEMLQLLAARSPSRCFVHGLDEAGDTRFDAAVWLAKG